MHHFARKEQDHPCGSQPLMSEAMSQKSPWKSFKGSELILFMLLGIFVTRPNPKLHFAPFLSTHFFPCLNPIFKNGSFCPSSPFDLPKYQTLIIVRVFVKASPAEGRRGLHKNTARAHLWRFSRVAGWQCSVERPAEGPKVGVQGVQVVQGV